MEGNNFSTEKLIMMLEDIKQYIQNGYLSKIEQENLWDTLNWNKYDPENKELTKYLFTGWLIHQNISIVHS
jgi:hypothetical protein